MCEGHIETHVVLGHGPRIVDRSVDSSGDLLQTTEPASSAHPLLSSFAPLDVGRLISAGPTEAEHGRLRRELLEEGFADIVPVIGIQVPTRLNFLRGTGHVDRDADGDLRLLPIVREQNMYAVVLEAFDMAEVGPVRRPVHPRRTVQVGHPPVVCDDRMAEPPTDASFPARLPRLANCLRQSLL